MDDIEDTGAAERGSDDDPAVRRDPAAPPDPAVRRDPAARWQQDAVPVPPGTPASRPTFAPPRRSNRWRTLVVGGVAAATLAVTGYGVADAVGSHSTGTSASTSTSSTGSTGTTGTTGSTGTTSTTGSGSTSSSNSSSGLVTSGGSGGAQATTGGS